MSELEIYESDNLIYNRYDLIFNSYQVLLYEHAGKTYKIMFHKEGEKAYINLWGKVLPQSLFEQIIESIFEKNEETAKISLLNCGNNYKGFLAASNDIYIYLPQSVEELLSRLKAKHRYNLNREKRLFEESLGKIKINHYKEQEIPIESVRSYFDWKKMSHGTEYRLSEWGYIKKYFVTDALVLYAGDHMVGVAFYCCVDDVAYFENFSFNPEYKKYSAGYITYELLLEQLIKQGIKVFYLGGGNYEYKKKFGALEIVSYSGHIYNTRVIDKLNRKLMDLQINTIVIYGLGKYGNEFLRISKKLKSTLVGGIDREKKEIDGLQTFVTDDVLPNANAAIITMKKRNTMVEEYLKRNYNYVFYMSDLLKG